MIKMYYVMLHCSGNIEKYRENSTDKGFSYECGSVCGWTTNYGEGTSCFKYLKKRKDIINLMKTFNLLVTAILLSLFVQSALGQCTPG
jgi:hypothetical protein